MISEIKKINLIVFPLILSRIFSYFFIFIDQWIGTTISRDSFIAISFSEQISYIIIGAFGAISLTLNILGSRFLKENNLIKYSELFNVTFTITNILGILFTFISFVFSKKIFFYFFEKNLNILNLSSTYFKITSLGIWLTLILFIFSSFYKTQGKSKVIMFGSLFNNITNIILSCYLVFICKFGVIGAAIGTLSGIVINFLIYVIYFKCLDFFKLKFLLKSDISLKILKKYFPLLFQEIIEDTIPLIGLSFILSKFSPQLLGNYNFLKLISEFLLVGIYSYSIITMNMVIQSKNTSIKKYLPIISSLSMFIVFIIFNGLFIIFQNKVFYLYSSKTWVVDLIKDIFIFNSVTLIPNIFLEIYKTLLNGFDKENFVIKILFIEKILFLAGIFLFKIENLKSILLYFGILQGIVSLIFIYSYYKNTKSVGN